MAIEFYPTRDKGLTRSSFLFLQEMTFYVNFTSFCLRVFFAGGPALEIRDYLFGDVRQPSFARHLRMVLQGRDACLRQLEDAWSRKNGFGPIEEPDEPDTEDPHWIYGAPESDLWLQATNCSDCGNYVWGNTMGIYGLPHRIICSCIHNN